MTTKNRMIKVAVNEELVEVEQLWENFTNEDETVLQYLFLTPAKYANQLKKQASDALINWLMEECDNSILLKDNVTKEQLLSTPIYEYMYDWLDECHIPYIKVLLYDTLENALKLTGKNAYIGDRLVHYKISFQAETHYITDECRKRYSNLLNSKSTVYEGRNKSIITLQDNSLASELKELSYSLSSNSAATERILLFGHI